MRYLGKDGGPVGWWGRPISRGRGIDSLTSVLDISNVASVGISSVGHGLETAIGKSNVVFSLGGIAVAGLRGSKVGTAVSVIDSIGVVVCWGYIRVDRGGTISGDWDWSWAVSRSRSHNWSRGNNWSRGWGNVLRGSSSGSQDGEESNKAL